MNDIPVALVDDHHLVRNGVAATVNELGGYQVTLEAAHGRELIDQLKQFAQARRPLPEIAIIDLNMPVMDGYATLAWLRANEPTIRPLALTFDATDDAMVRAVRSGARGFILKNAHPDQLKLALDNLMDSGFHYSDEVHEALLRGNNEGPPDRDHIRAQITDREHEFLLHVCSDNEPTYAEICAAMGVHRRSLDNYRESLFSKFNIKSKTGLVLFAMRYGLVK